MKKRLWVALALIAALLPTVTMAQPVGDGSPYDILIRINAPVQVRAGESSQSVAVIGNDAVIDGEVDVLVVVNGNATITGTVTDSVIIVNGKVTLGPTSRVTNDVQLYRSTVDQQAGSFVGGEVRSEWGGGVRITRAFWFGFWLSMTLAVIAAGMLFAAAGSRQLLGAARATVDNAGPSALAAVALWVGAPVVAMIAMMTVVGIPLGMGILLVLLPALWFIGYLVAGASIGVQLLPRLQRSTAGETNLFLATAMGLTLLQIVVLFPFVGGAIAFVAGLFGAGAVVFRVWGGWRGVSTSARPTGPDLPVAPAI